MLFPLRQHWHVEIIQPIISLTRKKWGNISSCLEKGTISMFPIRKERRRQKRNLKKKEKIKIYCVCRMPELPTTKLIECSLCKEWFHFTCMNMDENSSVCNTIWHCTNCLAWILTASYYVTHYNSFRGDSIHWGGTLFTCPGDKIRGGNQIHYDTGLEYRRPWFKSQLEHGKLFSRYFSNISFSHFQYLWKRMESTMQPILRAVARSWG